jgi:phosphoribosylanthranilate isomerase
MTKIKICGITNKKDALAAAALGIEMLGFIFYKKSKRYVDPKTAEDIINELPAGIVKVGVFVDEPDGSVIRIAEDAALTALQFHGSETPEYCASFKGSYGTIKAFNVKDVKSLSGVNGYDTDYCLFDAHCTGMRGGTGKTFDWKLISDFEVLKPIILSGGLTSDNVAEAIARLSPYAVDVSSGVEESPGKKDHVLMKAFVENVRRCG